MSAVRWMRRLFFGGCGLVLFTILGPVSSSWAASVSGQLLSNEPLSVFTQQQLAEQFQTNGIPFEPKTGVKVFRFSYATETPGLNPRIVEASGIIIVPNSPLAKIPWISLQHGTILSDAQTPSVQAGEGLLEGSLGFLTVVPDYLGYGKSSDLFHPYFIEQAYERTGVDALRAARTFAAQQGLDLGSLYLKGYSEGGFATLALQKALETTYAGEFDLRASAPSAGPYNLEGTALQLFSKSKINPVYSTFILLAFDHWLANPPLDLDAIFAVEPSILEGLFDGSTAYGAVLDTLPSETSLLLEPGFLDEFLKAVPADLQTSKIRRWLQEQDLLDKNWVPSTPTRLYHCQDDEIVPVEATVLTYAAFKNAQPAAPIASVIIPSVAGQKPYQHGTCPAIFSPVQWFLQLN